jgi:hypothetical protein
MSEEKSKPEIKEYAGGWITERKGTEVPGFLRIAFPIIGLGCTAYFIAYMNGETSHEDRGKLVQIFNQATTSADGLMYAVAGMALIFVIIVVMFAFSRSHEE